MANQAWTQPSQLPSKMRDTMGRIIHKNTGVEPKLAILLSTKRSSSYEYHGTPSCGPPGSQK